MGAVTAGITVLQAMEAPFQEIETALNARLYYLALMSSLALPDICACLESPTGENKGRNGKKYKDWYDRHVSKRVPSLTAADCYSYRCGVLHQGSLGNNGQFVRVLFTLPDGRGNVFASIKIVDSGGLPPFSPDTLTLDLVTFCRNIMDAVREWAAEAGNNQNVIRNLPRLVRYRKEGIFTPAIFLQGIPVIA